VAGTKGLSAEVLAGRLGVSVSTVKRWLKSGELGSVKIGGRRIVLEVHLRAKFGEEAARDILAQ
jgi:excisionase family DNA binding protein